MTNFTGLKQFRVKHTWLEDVEAVIQIDFDRPDIYEQMKVHYEFFHSLDNPDDKEEILEKFLQHIAGGVWFVSASGEYNTQGVRRHVTELEGYPHLDGQTGFWLMSHEHPEVEDYDFEIEATEGVDYFVSEG